ncbi:diphthine--ammonia ligase [Cetobacterium sp. SF1]|uniref:Dph6-related ATP pyrophosphatase n=1 Tax=unclassified Cetobacterium TaxID=2630983 RepID=UPI003CF07D78
MEKKKFIMSYSCGKDSTLALDRMINQGHTPLALIITINKSNNSSWFHSISSNHMKEVANSLDIPLMLIECDGEDYEASFSEALKKFKEIGADSCVFGDIDIDAHREWCEKRCIEANLNAIFPLWNESREKLVYEFIDKGYNAVIKVVNLNYLPIDFLGKTLSKDVVESIKNNGADPCGENGEYHTFVYNGPLFKYPIKFSSKEKLKKDNYGVLIID